MRRVCGNILVIDNIAPDAFINPTELRIPASIFCIRFLFFNNFQNILLKLIPFNIKKGRWNLVTYRDVYFPFCPYKLES